MIQLASGAFLVILAVPALDHRLGWSRVPVTLVIVGDALVACGFLVVFLVFKENSYASAVVEAGAEQKVVDTGPYAVVRHPMYAGALVLLAGVPLALGSFWGLRAGAVRRCPRVAAHRRHAAPFRQRPLEPRATLPAFAMAAAFGQCRSARLQGVILSPPRCER
jgi:hypothetical protein